MAENGIDTKNILAALAEFSRRLYGRGMAEKPEQQSTEKCGIERFTLLLSGISSCRRLPGIEGHMGYEELRYCDTEESREQARNHLKRMYGVSDAESLYTACRNMFHAGDEYDQFQSFWRGEPAFDEGELNDFGRHAFETCKAYAENFRPFVGTKGFHAWDFNEQVGLARNAVAAGILSEKEFWEFCRPMARQAAAIYTSWEEYAMSCLCGAVYFMFCESSMSDEGISGFYEINRNLLEHLLSSEGAWGRNSWFRVKEKKWAKGLKEMRELLAGWEEAEGCFATDRILVDGSRVGYMYREEPNPEMPDSGWRFFAGDESDDYANNPENVGIYHLNTLCNYDPDILPLLHASYGTAYFRDEDGVFQEEELQARE